MIIARAKKKGDARTTNGGQVVGARTPAAPFVHLSAVVYSTSLFHPPRHLSIHTHMYKHPVSRYYNSGRIPST